MAKVRQDSLYFRAEYGEGYLMDNTDATINYKEKPGSLCILTPEVTVCNRKTGIPCYKGWIEKTCIADQLTETIDIPDLRQWCSNLNSKCDAVFTHRVDFVLKYLCVKKDSNDHFCGRAIVLSYELGYSGITAKTVVAVFRNACIFLQQKFRLRIHHIFFLEIRVSKSNNLVVGGCPDIIHLYQKRCHPAVCVCEKNGATNQCHFWFFNTLLGGDTNIKTGHPFAIFPNNRVSFFRPLTHTITQIADDTVFGGVLLRSGLSVQFEYDIRTNAPLGYTGTKNNGIQITINTALCVNPQVLGETVMHELAHARVILDTPVIIGQDPHGNEWLERMTQLRAFAPRLSDAAMTLCTRTFDKKVVQNQNV